MYCTLECILFKACLNIDNDKYVFSSEGFIANDDPLHHALNFNKRKIQKQYFVNLPQEFVFFHIFLKHTTCFKNKANELSRITLTELISLFIFAVH